MPGSDQRQTLRDWLIDGSQPVPEDRFVTIGPGNRVACRECGAVGWPAPEGYSFPYVPWQIVHLYPHLYRCTCGGHFLSPGGVASHVRAALRRGQEGHAFDTSQR